MAEIAMMLVAGALGVVVPNNERHAIGICRTADILEIIVSEEVRTTRFLHYTTILSNIYRDVPGDIFLL
jgi:hypothetical protein